MSALFSRFLAQNHGNFAMMTALALLPIALVVGVGVDYSRNSTTRSNMQNALDAAALAAVTRPGNLTAVKREEVLKEVYKANGGLGEAELVGDLAPEGDMVVLTARAKGDQPTTFMRLGGVDKTTIVVGSKVGSQLKLMQIAFNFKWASGWWDKEVSLMGRKAGSQDYTKLASIHYSWNGKAGQTGDHNVGNTTVQLMRNGQLETTFVQHCPDAARSSCQTVEKRGDQKVDVSEIDQLYLRMEISAPTYKRAKDDLYGRRPAVDLDISTDDPKLSNRLFVDGRQQPAGKPVDIYRVVGCSQTTDQTWEDGGNFKDQDFAYSVQGFCAPANKDRNPILVQ